MTDFLEKLKNEANKAYTENGAATNASTLSDCLDLFATSGALRNATKNEITERFARAFSENPDYATRILFYTRDIRGGLGERRFFRTVLKYLAEIYPETVIKNLGNITEYGRFDDILTLLGTPCEDEAVSFIKNQLDSDMRAYEKGEQVSLLAKWLPSVNASNGKTVKDAKIIAKKLGLTDVKQRYGSQ